MSTVDSSNGADGRIITPMYCTQVSNIVCNVDVDPVAIQGFIRPLLRLPSWRRIDDNLKDDVGCVGPAILYHGHCCYTYSTNSK
jgi:hypothetical protein